MKLKDDIATFYAKNRKEWRAWLSKNHTKEKNVWLIIYKKENDVPTIHYEDAVMKRFALGGSTVGLI